MHVSPSLHLWEGRWTSILVFRTSAFLKGSPENWPMSHQSPSSDGFHVVYRPEGRRGWRLQLGAAVDRRQQDQVHENSQLSASSQLSEACFLKSNRTSFSKEIFYKTSTYKTEKSSCVKGRSPKPCPFSLFQLPSATDISVELSISKRHRQKKSTALGCSLCLLASATR